MAEKPVLEIEKPQYTVKLYSNLLEVDLKKGAKKSLREFVEEHEILRATVGVLLETIAPLHLSLRDISKVHVNENVCCLRFFLIKETSPFH